ncbi:MAG TPA: SpoIIE family protein phosphatase [Bacteroidia bacterium]|nr:SpoIIE family protein phosphatase [Bacteroidia bacterium]
MQIRDTEDTDSKIGSLSRELENLKVEKESLLSEKKKSEEKNRKLWAMSEAVHKERRLVDEANEHLSAEKDKLEAEKKKLDEKVKKLWQTSTAIHKEKERINELKLEIEQKHQEILDSVNYAQRIQKALLPGNKFLEDSLPEHFILFLPKDIVSGDFYWASRLENSKFALVTADSTGHGVPGAIMSILNISCLSEAVNAHHLSEPNEILNYTRRRIMEHMANDGSEEGGKDGMDAVICCFDVGKYTMSFSAANNPVWLLRNGELTEFKPDKMPVGKAMGDIKPFSRQEVELKKGDLVISLTDGFADQFGGAQGKKFMYKPLKALLLDLHKLSMEEIREKLKQKFEDWKGETEQVDDVLLIGVRIP